MKRRSATLTESHLEIMKSASILVFKQNSANKQLAHGQKHQK
jgi:hypothetical protein